MTTNITPNDDRSANIRMNEDKPNVREEFADTQQNQADAEETSVSGILAGDVNSLHQSYEKRALAIGVPALDFDEFWNRFRRRYPGTDWGWRNYGTDEQDCIGRAVMVVLNPEDKSQARLISKWGWFENDGYDAVVDAFIKTQDSFSGEPHSELWF